MLLYHLKGIETYSIYNDRDIQRLGASEAVGHRQMTESLGFYRDAKDMHYIKTHNTPGDDFQAIYIVRDVRDVMVSYAHYRREIENVKGDFDTVLRNLITNKLWSGWSTHVRMWVARPQTVDVIKYEDMVRDPTSAVEADGDMPSFEELHSRWPRFFRKGKTGSWEDEMSPEIEQLCWKYHGKVMEGMGYER